MLTADGRLQSVTELNTLYDVMDDKGKPRPVDERVMPFLKGEKAQTEVLPLVNNFDPIRNEWQPDVTAKFMADPAARQRFRDELHEVPGHGPVQGHHARHRGFSRKLRETTTTPWCKNSTTIFTPRA